MIERSLQQYLNEETAGSPRARELLQQLAGRSLAVKTLPLGLTLRLTATAERLVVNESTQQAPTQDSTALGVAAADVTLEGSLLSLARLASDEAQAAIRSGAVKLTGDAATAERFQELLQLLRPDFGLLLAKSVGNVPAAAILNVVGWAVRTGTQVSQTLRMNVGEYLTHEKQWLVTRAEAQDYLEGVDQLRERSDRLAARLALHETRPNSLESHLPPSIQTGGAGAH